MNHFVSLVEGITVVIPNYKMTALKCGTLFIGEVAHFVGYDDPNSFAKILNVTKKKPLLRSVIKITFATFYKAYWGSSAMVSTRTWKTLANLNTSLTWPFWMFLLLCFQLCKLS